MRIHTHPNDVVRILAPVTLAGCVYILFRHESLLLFDALQQVHLLPLIHNVRDVTVPMGHALPDWFLFSLPDGLWLLSYLLFIRHVWAGRSAHARWGWTAMGLIISIGHEFAQAAGWVMGTFDWVDVLAYTMATWLAWAIDDAR